MGRPLRMFSENGLYFVTARTTQARMLLRPSSETNELVGGVLARAVRKYDVKLYGFVVTSNHLHLLVQIRDAGLSEFMKYLLSNIAKKVGKLVSWSGAFWERRFSSEPVLDDGAMVGRLRYILEHGVKEGLVPRVSDWPGLSCVTQLLGKVVRTFRWFNWAKRWRKGKIRADEKGLLDEEYAEPEQLELAVLPCWQGLSADERRKLTQSIIADIERVGSKSRRKPKAEATLSLTTQHPHARPVKRKKSPRPPWLCHATFAWLRDAFREKYAAFVAEFRLASERFRKGDLLAAFPPLAFRPPVLHRYKGVSPREDLEASTA